MAWTVSGNIFTDAARLAIGSLDPNHLFTLAQNADPATMQAEVSTAVRQAMPGASEADIQATIAATMGQVAKTYNQAIASNPLWTDSAYTPSFASASGDPNATPWFPDLNPAGGINPLWVVAAAGVGMVGIAAVTK